MEHAPGQNIHYTSLNEFKSIRILQSKFSKHHGMKLEVSNGEKFEPLKICGSQLSSKQLMDQDEIIREVRKSFQMNGNDDTTY
jgi:hypothetical protein